MLEQELRDREPGTEGKPSAGKAPRWLDLRHKSAGSWAFLLNRLTGLGLTFYLGLHLIVLNKLAQGQQAYDAFIAFSHSPLIKAGEVVLIAAVVFHALNGLRLTLHAFGIGLRSQKALFLLALSGTILASTLFAIRLFSD